MLNKVKAIGIFTVLAALGGGIAYLGGVDTVGVFGPTFGGLASWIIGYLKGEPYQKVVEYLEHYAQDPSDPHQPPVA